MRCKSPRNGTAEQRAEPRAEQRRRAPDRCPLSEVGGSICAVDTTPLSAIEAAVGGAGDEPTPAARLAALNSISPAMIDDVVFGADAARLGAAADGRVVAIGVAASPGVGVGRVAVDPVAALDSWEAGRDVVLVVDETTPADEPAMRVASAIVTRRGSLASHAAIIARQYGIPAVCGVGEIEARAGEQWLVDGATGEVRHLDDDSASQAGRGGPALSELPTAVKTLLAWADEVAAGGLVVMANADDENAVRTALSLGASGVGLCRTEHQFLGEAAAVVARLLAGDHEVLAEFAQHQRAALRGVFSAAEDRPITVRLLDAPSHEFGGVTEHNPMLGVRGIRLGLMRPEILEAQAVAAAEAWCDVAEPSSAGRSAAPRVRLCLGVVAFPEEVAAARSIIDAAVERVGSVRGRRIDMAASAMVETPRAALCTAMFATEVDSICFGTNDLTQLTYGLSRDDSAELVAEYRRRGILERDPFATLDHLGVARLLALAAQTATAANPEIALSMCGEHAADPASIAIAAQLGITTLSVSPYRVPATRLAAARCIIEGDGRR